MEFPNLGEHCFEKTCKVLDFLPMRCNACQEVFCKDHYFYTSHSCEKAYTRDVQVPICPLCNQPVPIKRGELPDISVGDHIDRDCQSDRALKKRNAVFTNKCTRRGCKQKEMIPVLCSDCKLNFCLKHRHPSDHECNPREQRVPRSFSGNLAADATSAANSIRNFFGGDSSAKPIATRGAARPPRALQASVAQANMSEDEALALALQASLNDNKSPSRSVVSTPGHSLQEEEDRQLAQAIAASQRDYSKNKDKCCVS